MVFVKHRGARPAGASVGGSDPAAWDALVETWSPGADVGERLRQQPDWPLIQQYIPKGSRVLEAGCGLAKWVWCLQDQGYEAYGIDFSQAAVAKSLERWPDLRLELGRIQEMPYEDGFFDGIVSFGAIEHDEAGPQAMLAEMHRVLRPEGVLYCTVPCHNLLRRAGLGRLGEFRQCNRTLRKLRGLPPDIEFWQYSWTASEYEQILRGAGFNLIAVQPLVPSSLWRGRRQAGLRRRFVDAVHKRCPWLMPHMMAGICVKPEEKSAAQALDGQGIASENA